MSREYIAPSRINLIWHLLFCDMLIQFFRLGGIEVIDILIHGLFVGTAAVLMWREEEINVPPVLVSIACTLALVIALVQLIPLSEGMTSIFAPVKERITHATLALFPDLSFHNQLTFIPDFHLFRTASLALDICLILMLTAVDKPSGRVVRYWTIILGFSMGLLTILGYTPLTEPDAILGYYRDTHGGFINRNHFANFAVLVLILLSYQGISLFRRLRSNSSRARMSDGGTAYIGQLLAIVAAVFLILMECRNNWSRSAVLNIAIAISVFGGLLLLEKIRGQLRHRWWLPLLIAAPLILAALFLPLGRGVEKLMERGVGDTSRIEMWRVGVDYVSEGQFLGTGLGSTAAILEPVQPKDVNNRKDARRFHNDFLQVLVEFGPFGFIALMLLLAFVLRSIWVLIRDGRRDQRLLAYAAAAVVAVLCFHSMIDFPLRLSSIRNLSLIFVFYAIKEASEFEETYSSKPLFLIMTPLILFAVGYTGYLLYEKSKAPFQNLPEVESAYRYGESFRAPFFVAKTDFGRVFTQEMDVEAIQQKIDVNRERFKTYMHGQPFSIKSLNFLLMMEVIEYRMQTEEYVEADFLEFERKALGIRDLANDSNFQARAALFFVYSAFEQHLDRDRGIVLLGLQEENDIRIRSTKSRMKRRALGRN